MAEIRNLLAWRHLRAEPSSFVLHYKNGALRRSGRGASFWFLALDAAIAEVPVDDRELSFLFHGRCADFQDLSVQGVLSYRVVEPTTLAERVDFGIDLRRGQHLREPLAQLSALLTQLAQQFAHEVIVATGVRELLVDGHERIRERIRSGLLADDTLASLGLELVSIRVAALRPAADVEKALEAPMRERIQQDADEATFARRALAVEKERAIAENELQSRIELARREEQLITQHGANARQRATEAAEAGHIEAKGAALRSTIEAEARAAGLRLVEQVKIEAERERMEIHRELPPAVLFGLAAQKLATKLHRIDHLNLSPDTLGPLLTQLVSAQTHKLEREAEQS